MASYNLSSTEVPIWIDNKEAAGTIAEGAVLKYSSDFDKVVVATGETDIPMGVARHAAVSGDRVSIIRSGRANVLLLATAACTQGTPAIVNGASGHVINWTNENPSWSIGQFELGKTAGAAAELVPVALNIYKIKP